MSDNYNVIKDRSKKKINYNIKDISKMKKILTPKEKIIVLLGETGKGKSTFINEITKKDECREGNGTNSTTEIPQLVNYDHEGYNFYFIDTPGLNDKKGDEENIKQIKDLKKGPCPSTFIIMLGFIDMKITASIQNSLIEFMKIFPAKDFWDHTIIVRNFSFEDKCNIKGKILEGIINDETLKESMNELNINEPQEIKELFIDLKSPDNMKNELLNEILNLIKKMHPIYKEVNVDEEEIFEEKKEGFLEHNKIIKTRYVDYNNIEHEFIETIPIIIYNFKDLKPSLISVRREKTNQVKSDCCCKKYKYNYILVLIYKFNNTEKYRKEKILDSPYESEDNEVEGERYRDKLEKEQEKIYQNKVVNY